MEKELVLVLDFGGQYNKLTARRVRELSVYSEMLPYDSSLEEIQGKTRRLLFLPGGLPVLTRKMLPAVTRVFSNWGYQFWVLVMVCS